MGLRRLLHPIRILRVICVVGFCALLTVTLWQVFLPDGGNELSDDQKVLNYMASHLDVFYRLVANQRDRFHVDITLTNTGPEVISTGDWSIYFHHMKYIDTDDFNNAAKGSLADIFRIHHVNSYLFRLTPTPLFPNLTTDEYVTFRLTGGGWMVSRSDVIPNWYISMDRSNSSHPRLLASTASEDVDFVAPFDDVRKWKRAPGDWYEPYSPEDRYIRSKIKDMESAPRPILPTPVSIEIQQEVLRLDSSWSIMFDKGLGNEAEFLSIQLGLSYHMVLNPAHSCSRNILLHIDPSVADEESADNYELYVDPRRQCVTVTGKGQSGVFYGCQSLLHLIPSSLRRLPAVLSGLRVMDYPRFSYRGVMVDVSRNFFGPKDIMDLLEAMAAYKMNVLHLHLADDEGWRLEIPGLPELTQVGGQRCHDLKERVCLMPFHGSGPFNNTGGSGFYSVAEYTSILRFAQSRHITIIPEFDMPGHSHAAIHSMEARYFKMAEQGRLQDGLRFLLSDLRDTSVYRSGQFFKDSAINACLESSYRFVKFVMEAVIHMHQDIQPLKRFHFGGDEVPGAAYEGSPACQQFKRQNPSIRSSKQLKTYFVRRVAGIASSLGVGLQGWEDAFSTFYGGNIPVQDMKLKEVASNMWYHIWGSNMEANVYNMANTGYKVILTSTSHLYFDNPQEPDPEDWGLHWATRYVDTKRTFYYRPDSFYDNIDFGYWGDPMNKESVCASGNCPPLQQPQNILGMSGALWTEEVRTRQRLDQMLWPRLLSVAERSWHKAKWEEMSGPAMKQERAEDWRDFANTLGYKEYPRLEQMGIQPYLPPPGVIFDKGRVVVNTMFPGLKVQYSRDKVSWYDYSPTSNLHGRFYFATVSPNGSRHSRVVTYKVPEDK